MIERRQGDILAADAEALVATVNCVGVMGRGIALQFRKAFPENYAAYRAACRRGELRPGRVLVHRLERGEPPRYIVNFPTKEHWRGRSRLEYIDSGLAALVREVQRLGIRSLAIPPLGCGLGGLRWEDVRPRIERAFAGLPEVRVLLYEPCGAPPPAAMAKSPQAPRMTLARAVALQLFHQYLSALLDPFLTLLEAHKLLYFMQAAGQDLSLRYRKAPYGPYAENLRHLLIAMDGHFLRGYGDGEDAPDRPIEIDLVAAEAAAAFLRRHPPTQERFERVSRLIRGFETPYGMELLSTVHWVATQEGAGTLPAAIEAVYAWNPRKSSFPEHHLELAWSVLAEQGWLSSAGPARPGR